jgi:hypothetical protein
MLCIKGVQDLIIIRFHEVMKGGKGVRGIKSILMTNGGARGSSFSVSTHRRECMIIE